MRIRFWRHIREIKGKIFRCIPRIQSDILNSTRFNGKLRSKHNIFRKSKHN